MNKRKSGSVASGVLWTAGRAWGTRLFSMLVFFVLARMLEPAEIGLVNYVLGWIMILLVLADLGLAEYLVFHREAGEDYEQAIFWFQVGSSTLLALLVSGLALFGAFDSELPHAAAIVAVLAWTLPVFAARRVPDAVMRRDMRFRDLAVRSMVAIVIAGVVGLAAAVAGLGAWALVIKQWVEVIADVAVLYGAGIWRPRRPRRLGLVREALGSSWGMIGSRLLDVASQRLDTIVIGSLLGMTNLGYYSVAQRIYQMLQEGLGGAITSVMSSKFASMAHDKERLKATFLTSVGAAGLVIGPIMLLGATFAPDLITLLLGERWTASTPVLTLLCLAGVAGALLHSSLGGFLLLSLKRQGEFMVLMGTNFAATFGLIFALSPFGLMAVAAVPAIRVLVTAPISLRFAWRVMGCTFKEHARAMVPAWAVVFSMAAVFLAGQWLFPQPSWIRLGLLGAATVATGALVAVLGFRSRLNEIVDRLRSRKKPTPTPNNDPAP